MPWNRGGNNLVELCRSVDVRRWQRDGLLIDRHTTDENYLTNQFNWRWHDDVGEVVASITVTACPYVLWLKYRFSFFEDEWHQVNERIRLTHTTMNFGGERVWFQCPKCN